MLKKNLIFIFKNYAEIEYLAPIINDNENMFDILVFDYNKKSFLKNCPQLYEFLNEKKVKIYDTTDLLRNNFLIKLISNKIDARSPSIKSNLSYIILNLKFKIIFNFLLKTIFKFIYQISFKNINFFKKYKKFLVGHRQLNKFFFQTFEKSFLKYLDNFIFIPHGPHYEKTIVPSESITNLEKVIIFSNKKYLNIIANYNELPWKNNQYDKLNCAYLPYPLINYNLNNFNSKKIHKKNKKILILLRTFNYFDNHNISKNEFSVSATEILNLLKVSYQEFYPKYDIYIKPHPATNTNELRNLLISNNLNDLKFIHDPIFLTLCNFDFVISFKTTSIFLMVANKIPVIFYNPESTKNYKMTHEFSKIYDSIAYYTSNNIDDLKTYFKCQTQFDPKKLIKNQEIIKDKFKVNKNFNTINDQEIL